MPNGSSNRRASASTGRRRSTRNVALNPNGKREAPSDSWNQWRGERRSSRLGAPPDTQLDLEPPLKRARTEESTMSTNSADAPSAAASSASHGARNGLNIKTHGVAALEPTEIPLEQIAGKKRSKFWFYAVTVPKPAPEGDSSTNGAASSEINGHKANGNGHNALLSSHHENGVDFDRSLEGSLSPLDSA